MQDVTAILVLCGLVVLTLASCALMLLLLVFAVLTGPSNITLDESRPDSARPPPVWQRSPTRVRFDPSAGGQQAFAIRGYVAEVVTNPEDDEESDD